jgi:hypothetical protein
MAGAIMLALQEKLRSAGIIFDRGMTEVELDQAQKMYELAFPVDLREFLSCGLPISPEFPNWRTGIVEHRGQKVRIKDMLGWPFEGICFDIEQNDFWMPNWGPKPHDLQKSFRIARENVARAPGLVPIYSHRFLPNDPLEAGNPVLSIWKTDIIYYGPDLVSYFIHEFQLVADRDTNGDKAPRRIRFWSDIIESQ